MRVGEKVVCPRCGKEGVKHVERFKAKGHVYYYEVVRHFAPPDWKVKKCVIKRVEAAEVPEPVKTAATTKTVKTEVAQRQREPVEARAPRAAVREVPPEGVDRIAWYATKIGLAWGCVRAAPSEETYAEFVNVARQIGERVGVDTSTAVAAVTKYYAERSKDATIAATTAVKEVVKAIMAKAGAKIEVPAKEVAAIDFERVRAIVREEVEKAVAQIAAQIKMPEVRVGKAEMAAVYRVFRQKQKVDETVREVAYKVWSEVFAAGRKIVSVEA